MEHIRMYRAVEQELMCDPCNYNKSGIYVQYAHLVIYDDEY